MTVIGDEHQAAGVEVQSTRDVQVVLVVFVQQIEHGRVLGVLGGADAAWRFVQHEITRGFAGLQHVFVELNPAELANVMVWVRDDLAINPHALFNQQQASLLAVELGQVAQKTVYAHSDQSQEIQACILREVFWGRRG